MALATRTVLASWARSHVNDLAGFVEPYSVPDATRNDEGLAGLKSYFASGLGVFENYGHGTGHQKENFVTVGMHLPVVRWFVP